MYLNTTKTIADPELVVMYCTKCRYFCTPNNNCPCCLCDFSPLETHPSHYQDNHPKKHDSIDALPYVFMPRLNGKTLAFEMQNALKYAIHGGIHLDKNAREAKKYTPKSIEYSADHKTVVVIWMDGDKTIVKRSDNDSDDIYMAFTAALAKKIFGSNSAVKRVIKNNLNEHKPKEKKQKED